MGLSVLNLRLDERFELVNYLRTVHVFLCDDGMSLDGMSSCYC